MAHTHYRRGVSCDAYLAELAQIPLLTVEHEQELARKIAQGDAEARDQLARGNLKLVVIIAKSYLGNGLPLEDLVSEGASACCVPLKVSTPSWVPDSLPTPATGFGNPSVTRSGATSTPFGCRTAPGHFWANGTAPITRSCRELGRAPRGEEVAGSLELSPKKMRLIQDALACSRFGAVYRTRRETTCWIPPVTRMKVTRRTRSLRWN